MLRVIRDTNVKIGSFYNTYEDCIVENADITNCKHETIKSEKKSCVIHHGKTENSKDLLKMINFDEWSRMKMLLNSQLRTGIAEVLNYSKPVDDLTRFLHYSHVYEENKFTEPPEEMRKKIKTSSCPLNTTHFVTETHVGIEVVVIMQLPRKDAIVAKIDNLLSRFKNFLEGENKDFVSTKDDEDAYANIIETKFYSNVTEVKQLSNLSYLYQYIKESANKSERNITILSHVEPITWLYPGSQNISSYKPPEQNIMQCLQDYFTDILKYFNEIEYLFSCILTMRDKSDDGKALDELESRWEELKKQHEERQKQIWILVKEHCNGQQSSSTIKARIESEDFVSFREGIRKLYQELKSIQKNFEKNKNSKLTDEKYSNLFDDTSAKVSENNNSNAAKSTENDRSAKDYQQGVTGKSKISTRKCPQTENSTKKGATPTGKSESPIPPHQNDTRKEEIINILLLGESGVGKSTFINAFINYLKFKTFNDVKSREPIVIIPVSFMMTIGNDFQEKVVKFGDFVKSKNEDFDNPGQSVTQECRSYLYHIENLQQKTFRLIDTPGFGDTRGLHQDDCNMSHILRYINSLSHLNAICFLLKPNNAQINPYFSACLSQLIDLLGNEACQKIVFCFTNSRSTFYTLGDTGPLLKTALNSLPIKGISLHHSNSYFFDSESFRYLVAIRAGIQFTENDMKDEYEKSWQKSSEESNRLMQYIVNTLGICRVQNNLESVKRAQIEITDMIRPILEAMRCTLRNLILMNTFPSGDLIEIIPKALDCRTTICLKCKYLPKKIDNVYVPRIVSYTIGKTCESCLSPDNTTLEIYYTYDYQTVKRHSNNTLDKMKTMIQHFMDASAIFARFLVSTTRSSTDDPFWIGLTEMIGEENDLGRSQREDGINKKLSKHLQTFLIKQEQTVNHSEGQDLRKTIDIHKMIDIIKEYPIVQSQMKAISETKTNLLKLTETQIS